MRVINLTDDVCVAQRSAREGKRERENEGAQGHMQCKQPMRGNAV